MCPTGWKSFALVCFLPTGFQCTWQARRPYDVKQSLTLIEPDSATGRGDTTRGGIVAVWWDCGGIVVGLWWETHTHN
jgi:hypothetical protein